MVESDKTFFGSLRFHEICLNFKFFFARITNVASICSICFYLLYLVEIGEVVVPTVEDVIRPFSYGISGITFISLVAATVI